MTKEKKDKKKVRESKQVKRAKTHGDPVVELY